MSSEVNSPGWVLQQSLRALIALATRQGLVQGLNLIGSVLLARLLVPGEYGVYAIVLFFIGLLARLATSGLGANLIRQSEEPADIDYRAVFTAQAVPVVLLAAGLGLGAPVVAGLYDLPDGGVTLMQLLAVSFLVSSLTTIPINRLERHLHFRQVALIEVLQTLVFQGTAVILAWRGYGILSFGFAVIARSVTGAVTAQLVSPWRPGFTRDGATIRRHARFGVVFQATFLVSTVKDSITTVFLGMLLGTAAVGYVGWAQMIASYPVLVLMATQRVYLPAFSRLREHPELLKRVVEAALQFANACAAPFAVVSLVLIEPITTIVFGEKWLEALPLFYLLWVANLFVPSVTPLLSLLYALGEPGLVLRFALLWAAATWILGMPLILWQGAIGFAIANALVQGTSFLLYSVVKRRLAIRILPFALPIWVIAGVLGAGLAAVQAVRPAATGLDLVLYATSLIGAFAVGVGLLYRDRVAKVVRVLRGTS
jgi:O-antigen/teichoic acid export membrane protein